MFEISDVIDWKFNNLGEVTTDGGKIIAFPDNVAGVNYDSGGIPTQADQDAWTAEYKIHLVDIAYIEKRKKDYLPLEEQADMKYWDEVNGTDNWIKHIEKVKGDNPKPDNVQ